MCACGRKGLRVRLYRKSTTFQFVIKRNSDDAGWDPRWESEMTDKYFLIKICLTLKNFIFMSKILIRHLIPDDFVALVGRFVNPQHLIPKKAYEPGM